MLSRSPSALVGIVVVLCVHDFSALIVYDFQISGWILSDAQCHKTDACSKRPILLFPRTLKFSIIGFVDQIWGTTLRFHSLRISNISLRYFGWYKMPWSRSLFKMVVLGVILSVLRNFECFHGGFVPVLGRKLATWCTVPWRRRQYRITILALSDVGQSRVIMAQLDHEPLSNQWLRVC